MPTLNGEELPANPALALREILVAFGVDPDDAWIERWADYCEEIPEANS